MPETKVLIVPPGETLRMQLQRKSPMYRPPSGPSAVLSPRSCSRRAGVTRCDVLAARWVRLGAQARR